MASWAMQQRQHFITAQLLEHGHVNRFDLMQKFGISVTQASVDLRAYRESGAFVLAYDPTAKTYRMATPL